VRKNDVAPKHQQGPGLPQWMAAQNEGG